MDKPPSQDRFPRFFFSFFVILFALFALLCLFGVFLPERIFSKLAGSSSISPQGVEAIHSFKMGLTLAAAGLIALLCLLFAIRLRLLIFFKSYRGILQKILLFLGSVFIILLLAETSLRIFLPQDFKDIIGPNADTFNRNYVSFNSLGFRDSEHSLLKPENTIRIAAVGDSFTFGYGIKNVNDTYLKLLEQLLNSNSGRNNYETLNFAKIGVDSAFEVSLIKQSALDYKPDIILVGYVLNDLTITSGYRKPSLFFWANQILVRFSYTYFFLKERWDKLHAFFGTPYYESVQRAFASPEIRQLNNPYFEELGRISLEKNITVAVAIFPFFYKFSNYPFKDAHAYVVNASLANGLVPIDLFSCYNGRQEQDLIIHPKDSHPNELAHALAAECILRSLEEQKVLPRKARK